jgi:hypothetical protein
MKAHQMYLERLRLANSALTHAVKHLPDDAPPHHPTREALFYVEAAQALESPTTPPVDGLFSSAAGGVYKDAETPPT